MARITPHKAFWDLVFHQHGVITHLQLRRFGFTDEAIAHRVNRGRLFPIFRGVFAVGRPEVSHEGRWMAAVLACGSGAVLSHGSGAALLRIGEERGRIEVSVPYPRSVEHDHIWPHRRRRMPDIVGHCERIPVASPADVLVDLATYLDRDRLEAAINAADRNDLIDPEDLRTTVGAMSPRPGVRVLKRALDIHTFACTDSALERMYLPLSDRAGLPRPETQRYLGSYRVDFLYRTLGLVVEANGLRYHRTPAQQAVDLKRSHAHSLAGLLPLTFSYGQIRYERAYVIETLAATAERLGEAA